MSKTKAPELPPENQNWVGQLWAVKSGGLFFLRTKKGMKYYPDPETNIFAAEDRPKPKRKLPSIPTIHFQGPTVSFREGAFSCIYISWKVHYIVLRILPWQITTKLWY